MNRQPYYHSVFRFLAKFRFIAWCLGYLIGRSLKNAQAISQGSTVCLVLKSSRLRGDIGFLEREARRKQSNLIFVQVPDNWLGRFYRWFYWYKDIVSEHTEISLERIEYRKFLHKCLPALRQVLDVRVVLGPQINDVVCIDWGAVFTELDVPYVVFHREGYMGSALEEEHLTSFGRSGRRFEGSLLAVQTEAMRRVFIDSRFVTPERIVVSGTLRMDDWLIAQKSANSVDERQECEKLLPEWVTLFSFGPGTGITMAEYWPEGWKEGEYLAETVRSTHVAVARFALRNPRVPVMIKPKWFYRWKEHLLLILNEAGISLEDVPNLHICEDIDAQAQIKRSRVIVGYGSTTLLEAAIAGKPVIVPEFGEIAAGQKWASSKTYPDVSDCFDLAMSQENLLSLLELKYKNPEVSEKCMERRRRAFERYVSYLDGSATVRSLRVLENLAHN